MAYSFRQRDFRQLHTIGSEELLELSLLGFLYTVVKFHNFQGARLLTTSSLLNSSFEFSALDEFESSLLS